LDKLGYIKKAQQNNFVSDGVQTISGLLYLLSKVKQINKVIINTEEIEYLQGTISLL